MVTGDHQHDDGQRPGDERTPDAEPGLNGARSDEALVTLLYTELKSLARAKLAAERPGHTLTPTALVHEVFLRLGACEHRWTGRAHFYLAAAEAMARVLVDHARARKAAKRGGGRARAVPLESIASVLTEDSGADEAVAVHEHLEVLRRVDEAAYRVVMLRFFAGLSAEQTADILEIDRRSVGRRWVAARAWLLERISATEGAA